jgi:hypothetical protein
MEKRRSLKPEFGIASVVVRFNDKSSHKY